MDEEALAAVVESGAALCPTFTLLGNLADYGERVGTAPELLSVFRAEIETTAKMVREAHAAGVPILAGSETGFAITPVGEWHARELELLVEYVGISPLEAIRCATGNGAFAMRMEGSIGTVEAGREADLLIVDGDPTRDITILQDKSKISAVISRGRLVDLDTPIPDRQPRSSDQVRLLAACPLTRSLAFSEEQLARLSRV
jgi:imidazolonepropionase-like amidohydrolase